MAEAKVKNGKTLRKITGKGVGFPLAAVREALGDKKETNLYTVIGVVSGAKPGSTNLGEFIKLVGEFKATNLVTGEVFLSGACILPSFVGDPIGMAALNPNNSGVQFAVTIGAEKNADSVAGFEYTAENLIPTSASSPLAQLEASIVNLLPKLKK